MFRAIHKELVLIRKELQAMRSSEESNKQAACVNSQVLAEKIDLQLQKAFREPHK